MNFLGNTEHTQLQQPAEPKNLQYQSGGRGRALSDDDGDTMSEMSSFSGGDSLFGGDDTDTEEYSPELSGSQPKNNMFGGSNPSDIKTLLMATMTRQASGQETSSPQAVEDIVTTMYETSTDDEFKKFANSKVQTMTPYNDELTLEQKQTFLKIAVMHHLLIPEDPAKPITINDLNNHITSLKVYVSEPYVQSGGKWLSVSLPFSGQSKHQPKTNTPESPAAPNMNKPFQIIVEYKTENEIVKQIKKRVEELETQIKDIYTEATTPSLEEAKQDQPPVEETKQSAQETQLAQTKNMGNMIPQVASAASYSHQQQPNIQNNLEEKEETSLANNDDKIPLNSYGAVAAALQLKNE